MSNFPHELNCPGGGFGRPGGGFRTGRSSGKATAGTGAKKTTPMTTETKTKRLSQ